MLCSANAPYQYVELIISERYPKIIQHNLRLVVLRGCTAYRAYHCVQLIIALLVSL